MDYIDLQTKKYLSHEDENPRWVEGQRKSVDYFFDGVDQEAVILDAGCGDAVGLEYLKMKGYSHVQGVDLSDEKILRGQAKFLEVYQGDLHDLSYSDSQFDVVFSSHSLEHCHDPRKVVAEFKRVLKPGGHLFIVLPFPDRGPLDAHCGSVELRSRTNDGGKGVVDWFKEQGFDTTTKVLDSYREPEIWLKMQVAE